MKNCLGFETYFHINENVFLVKSKGQKLSCLRYWEVKNKGRCTYLAWEEAVMN
jgi:hypothetical protein